MTLCSVYHLCILLLLCLHLLVVKKRLVFSQAMKDHHLALFILLLVVVDVGILSIYSLLEGFKGKLTATKHVNPEYPVHIEGVGCEV